MATMAGCLLATLGGCENGRKKEISLADQIEKLQQEETQLQRQIEQSKKENKQLGERIQVLTGVRAEHKLEDVYTLQSIKIHKYTGFYDKDEDGKKEKLIVYIQPIDRQGDIIKAPGAVDVQLDGWDGKRLGRWHVRENELKKLWFSTLIKGNYRLMFDIADKVDDFTEPFTVKVTFTDYLTGKIFNEQRAIKP
jgi:seryl-tRNA synthetase